MFIFPAVLNSMRNSLSVNKRRILGQQLPLFSTIQRNFITSTSILHKNRRPDLSREFDFFFYYLRIREQTQVFSLRLFLPIARNIRLLYGN
jgi:hypothetical protein